MRQVTIVLGTLFPLGSDDYHGVFNTGGSAPVLHNSQITCFGGTRCYGVYSEVGSPAILENVTIRASDATGFNVGVFSGTNSSTVLRNCKVQGLKGLLGASSTAYGIESSSSHPLVHHSILSGDTNAMLGSDPKVAYSQLVGPLAFFSAGSCLGAYDVNFFVIGNQCA